MSTSTRRVALLVLSTMVWTLFAVAAHADCASECDPYNSSCSQECQACRGYDQDGNCLFWRTTTCGANGSACIPDTCTPSWYESSRTNIGTYDGRSLNHCDHHKVDSVTVSDAHQCNVNSSYWSYTYCDDYIDDYKDGCCYPSCCDGYGELGTPLSCNGYHSCS